MKYIITERDPQYIKDFGAMLVSMGCTQIDAVTFECEQDLDLSDFHGLEPAAEAEEVDEYEAEREWLNSYNGDFPFYLSLKQQLAKKGYLSEKQWQALSRAVARTLPKPEFAKPVDYSVQVGQVLSVSRWLAQKIAQEAGLARSHYAMEVLEVHNESDRAIQVTVKLSARRTSHCSCCGRTLTDPASIANGIGPICAEKGGVSFGVSSLAELEAKLSVTVPVKTWIPKSAYKVLSEEAMAA